MKNCKKIGGVIKKVFGVTGFVLLIILLLYNLFLITQTLIRPDKTPSFFGIKTYIIVSGSMEPELNIGDMVIVKEVADTELKTGDIISYRSGGSVITHRIEQITEMGGKRCFKTKGDNNNVDDNNAIDIDSIEGKVINRIGKIGNVALFLQNKFIIILLVILFFVYLLYGNKAKRKTYKHEV